MTSQILTQVSLQRLLLAITLGCHVAFASYYLDQTKKYSATLSRSLHDTIASRGSELRPNIIYGTRAKEIVEPSEKNDARKRKANGKRSVRRAATPNDQKPQRGCSIVVVYDQSYLDVFNNIRSSAEQSIRDNFAVADRVFNKTDLSDNYRVRLTVADIHYYNESVYQPKLAGIKSAEEYRNAFSSTSNITLESYCLSVIYTARKDIDKPAFTESAVVDEGQGGGICSKRRKCSYGSGQCCHNAMMMKVSDISNSLSLTRELGHAFGVQCLDENNTGNCKKFYNSSCENKYVMTGSASAPPPSADDWCFSPCSISQIRPVLVAKGGCLAICGNGKTERGEECDCGNLTSIKCCCNKTTCRFKSSDVRCRYTTHCAKGAQCNGSSSMCPDAVFLPDGTKCFIIRGGPFRHRNNRGSCSAGQCILYDMLGRQLSSTGAQLQRTVTFLAVLVGVCFGTRMTLLC